MIQELEKVFLLEDLTGTPFVKGDIGTIVFIYPGNKAYEVEFFAVDGSGLGVEAVPAKKAKSVKGIKKVLCIDEAA